MGLVYYENWDGVTAPAMPSGWGYSGAFSTTSSPSSFTPTSSPNVLQFASSGSNGNYVCARDTSDGLSVNSTVSVQANLGVFAATGQPVRWGIWCYGTYATSYGSLTCYFGWLDWHSNEVGISAIVNGTETVLTSVTWTAGTVWYQPILTVSNNPLVGAQSLSIQRLSDSKYLTASNTWQTAYTTVVTSSDKSISDTGYAGLYAEQFGSGFTAYCDDWYFNVPSFAVRTNPLVAYYPFQYYPQFAE